MKNIKINTLEQVSENLNKQIDMQFAKLEKHAECIAKTKTKKRRSKKVISQTNN